MGWFIYYVLPMLITIVSGVLVYMFGELLNTIWLKPLQDYKNIKSDIAKYLVFYANVYTNILNESDNNGEWKNKHFEVSEKLRWLSAELEGFIQTLSWIKIGIPKKSCLKKAAGLLILLSNSMFGDDRFIQSKDNHNIANDIRSLLKIYGYTK